MKIEDKNTIEKNMRDLKSLFNVYIRVSKDLDVDKYRVEDVRRSVFQKCMICFRNCYINLDLAGGIISDEEKMGKILNNFITVEGQYSMDLDSIKFEYIQASKIGLQTLIFSCLESSLRTIYYILNLGSQTDNFTTIFRKLIQEFNMNTEYIKVFSILTNIRNTIHNNGVFVDHNERNYRIEYKSYTYIFNHNCAIKDVFISNLNDLYRGVVNFLKELISNERIKKIYFIEDMYSSAHIQAGHEAKNNDLIYSNIYDKID